MILHVSHPQSQGLTVRFKGTLLDVLHLYCNEKHSDWSNPSWIGGLFYRLHGYEPLYPFDLAILLKTPNQNVLEAITWLHEEWDAVLVLLRKAQVRQKASYDSRREVQRFKVCKLVLMPDEWGQRSWLDTTKARLKPQRDFPTWTTRSAYKVVKDGPNIIKDNQML